MAAADEIRFVRQSIKASASVPDRASVLAALDRIERRVESLERALRDAEPTQRIGGPRR